MVSALALAKMLIELHKGRVWFTDGRASGLQMGVKDYTP